MTIAAVDSIIANVMSVAEGNRLLHSISESVGFGSEGSPRHDASGDRSDHHDDGEAKEKAESPVKKLRHGPCGFASFIPKAPDATSSASPTGPRGSVTLCVN